MVRSIKKERRKGLLVYLSSFFFLLAGLSLFIPFCSYQIENGFTLSLTSYKVIFGGEDVFTQNGYIYSFSYKLNVPLLIMSQIFVLSFIASLLGKKDKTNIIIALLLGISSLVMDIFSIRLAGLSSSLIQEGLKPGVGYYFSIGLAILALITLLICLFPLLFKKKEKNYEL